MAPCLNFIILMAFIQLLAFTDAFVGVNYGMKGDNLPPPSDVINFVSSRSIQYLRLFEPNNDALEALRSRGIIVSLGTLNQDIPNLASNEQAAVNWLNSNVLPYIKDVNIKLISIGNEVIPGELAQSVLPAIQNMQKAVDGAGLRGSTFVSTVVSMEILGTSFPPSAGAFSNNVVSVMTDIIAFIKQTGAPLMLNVYPYFAYSSNANQISLDYALFKSTSPVVVDQGLEYYNLFDAMVDSVYAAAEKVGGLNNFQMLISETGWPSAGNEPHTSIINAQTYNNNLKQHVESNGTPKRPDVKLDTFIFALFNENLKSQGEEQNFGSFFPNKEPVYPLW